MDGWGQMGEEEQGGIPPPRRPAMWEGHAAPGPQAATASAAAPAAAAAGSPAQANGAGVAGHERDPLLDPWAQQAPAGARPDDTWDSWAWRDGSRWNRWETTGSWARGGWSSGGDWSSDPWQQRARGDYSDPPPWPGWTNYRLWKKSIARWNKNTDVKLARRGEKLMRILPWDVQLLMEHITESELAGEHYLDKIVAVLDVMAGEREDTEARRSLREAFYEGEKRKDESLTQYVARREQQFRKVALAGIDIPPPMQGMLLSDGAALNHQAAQNLRTLTGGSMQMDRIAKALREMEVPDDRIMARGGRVLLSLPEDETTATEEAPAAEDPEAESGDEGFLAFLDDQDVDEDDALEMVVAWGARQQHGDKPKKKTWAQNRDFKRLARKERKPGDGSSTSSSAYPPPPSAPDGQRKLSIDALKKVSRCRRCGKKGHWARGCPQPPSPRHATPGKAEGLSGYLHLEATAKQETDAEMTSLMALATTLEDAEAIVDPGAARCMGGRVAIQRYARVLFHHGLRPVLLDTKPPPARGVGGSAHLLGLVLLPVALGGTPGLLEFTVVEEDVPMLLSVQVMEEMGAIMDLNSNQLQLKKLDVTVEMRRASSGHRLVSLMTWSGGKFPVPTEVSRRHPEVRDGAFEAADQIEDLFPSTGDRKYTSSSSSFLISSQPSPSSPPPSTTSTTSSRTAGTSARRSCNTPSATTGRPQHCSQEQHPQDLHGWPSWSYSSSHARLMDGGTGTTSRPHHADCHDHAACLSREPATLLFREWSST